MITPLLTATQWDGNPRTPPLYAVGGETHALSLTIWMNSPEAGYVFARAKLYGNGDGSTVGETQPIFLLPTQVGAISTALVVPYTPGTYNLQIELWTRPVGFSTAFNLFGTFDATSAPILGNQARIVTAADAAAVVSMGLSNPNVPGDDPNAGVGPGQLTPGMQLAAIGIFNNVGTVSESYNAVWSWVNRASGQPMGSYPAITGQTGGAYQNNVPPGGSGSVSGYVQVPTTPGTYDLHMDWSCNGAHRGSTSYGPFTVGSPPHLGAGMIVLAQWS